MKPVQLYSYTGTNKQTSITLSDSYSNYKFIEIYGQRNAMHGFIKMNTTDSNVIDFNIVGQNGGYIGVVIVPSQENPSFSLEGATVYRDAGPLEFVRLICGASFVCTDSFHATALCINLGKDFVEFVRTYGGCAPSQGSRIMDLLRQYNLLYRIYSEDSVAWASHIDYSAIQKLLGSERTRCVEFLTNAIED